MQTQFTESQLALPALAQANEVLRTCVHCGLCLATCPTYALLGDERDSPRGRIYLIKDMLEQDAPADATVTRHIDRCLSCLSCMTTCPAGVDYMHLVDHARGHIERTWERPLVERAIRTLLGAVLPRPGLARLALLAARGPALLAPLFGGRLGALLRLAGRPSYGPSWVERPQIIPAQGRRCKRVALLTGCVQCVLAPEINEAAVRVLTRHGCEVVVPRGAGCCGALSHHLGDETRGHAQAGRTAAAFAREAAQGGLDAVVATASGCGTMLKDYGHLLKDDETPRRSRGAGGSARPRCQRSARRTGRLGLRVAADERTRRLSLRLLAPARPEDRPPADGAPCRRRLHRANGPRRAFLLRLGGHI